MLVNITIARAFCPSCNKGMLTPTTERLELFFSEHRGHEVRLYGTPEELKTAEAALTLTVPMGAQVELKEPRTP